MKDECNPRYGAVIERGKIKEKGVTAQDAAWYVVESMDNPGVTTPKIPGLTDLSADVGNKVCFFMFDDGTGCVLSVME